MSNRYRKVTWLPLRPASDSLVPPGQEVSFEHVMYLVYAALNQDPTEAGVCEIKTSLPYLLICTKI